MSEHLKLDVEQLPDLSDDHVTTRLTLTNQLLTDIDITKLPVNLRILQINNCKELPFEALPENIKTLNITLSNINEFDGTTFPHITTLRLTGNNLSSIIYPMHLITLDVSANQFESLPDFPPTLRHLYASENPLKELPDCTNLLALDIGNTRITEVPEVSDNLEYLAINQCPITSLPRLPSCLTYLDVSDLNLKDILLPARLEKLYMAGTQLTHVPYLPSKLIIVDLSKTLITYVADDMFPDGCINIDLRDTFVKKVPERLMNRANVQFIEPEESYDNKQLENNFEDGSDNDLYRQTDSPMYDRNMMISSDDEAPVLINYRPSTLPTYHQATAYTPPKRTYKLTLTHVVQL